MQMDKCGLRRMLSVNASSPFAHNKIINIVVIVSVQCRYFKLQFTVLLARYYPWLARKSRSRKLFAFFSFSEASNGNFLLYYDSDSRTVLHISLM